MIDNFKITSSTGTDLSTEFIATLRVQASDPDNAKKYALEEFENIFNALSLATGGSYDYELYSGDEVTPRDQIEKRASFLFGRIQFPFSVLLDSKMSIKTSEEAKEIMMLLNKNDEIGKRAFDYFLMGTRLKKWPRESFLNYFKSIELISNRYNKNLKNDIKRKMPDLESKEISYLMTNRRIILNACYILKINKMDEKIKSLVNIRNQYDVAHPTLKTTFKKEYTETCSELSRNMIINYLKTLN